MKRRHADTIQGLIIKALRAAGERGLRSLEIQEAAKASYASATRHLRILQNSKIIDRDGAKFWHLTEIKTAPLAKAHETPASGAPDTKWIQREIDSLDAQIDALKIQRDFLRALMMRAPGRPST